MRLLVLLAAAVALLGCTGDGSDSTDTTAAGGAETTTAPTTDPTTTVADTTSTTGAVTTTTTGGPDLTTGPPTGLPPGVDTEGVPEELLAMVGAPQPSLDLELGDEPTSQEVLEYLTGWHRWWRWALANRDSVDITAGVDDSSPLHRRFQEGEGLVELQPGLDFTEVTVTPTADVISISGTVSPESPGFALEEGSDAFDQVYAPGEPILVTIEIIPVGGGEWKVTVFELGQL